MSESTAHRAVGRLYERRDGARPRIELRGEGDDQQRVIVGYAAVFYRANDPGTEYRLWQDAYERVMPGAFDDALKNDVVRGLTNHDPNWLLGRSDIGTVRLSVDKTGLRYEIDAPDTQAGRDTVALLDRGDLDGSSFGFRVYGGKRGKVAWVEETRDARTIEIRELHQVELLDVGPVTYPAYESTEAGARGDVPAHLTEAWDEWLTRRSLVLSDEELLREMELQIRSIESDIADADDYCYPWRSEADRAARSCG